MIVTLIGMSGAGKSAWAAKFAAHGFMLADCDALLASKLQSMVGPIGGSLEQGGQWMVLPHEADFQRREALYLACETAILSDVIEQARACAASQRDCLYRHQRQHDLRRSSALAAPAGLLNRCLSPHPSYPQAADAG